MAMAGEETADEAARAVATLVREAGGRAWLVGGAVRDGLDGARTVKDVDLEVFGLAPARVQEVVGRRYAFDACGLSFGVLKLKHLDVDISLPRRETKRGAGHRGFLIDSDPSLSLREAASRRDFTINAIYRDPLTGEIADPFGGVADLRARVLRHVSPKFVEDPLRVLRGMQFIARFGLTPAPETVALCRAMTMEGLPPERLFEEWGKLLTKGARIGAGLAFLRETGWVRYFPELQRLIGCPQDPSWHPEGDVWNHTCLCLDAFARRRADVGAGAAEDLVVGLAVLCHDFGKPLVTRFDRGRYRSPGHDAAGVEPTLAFLRRLTNEERLLREVPPLVANHMQPFALWRAQAGDAAIRRLALRVGRIDRLIRVSRADDEGRGPGARSDAKAGDELRWLAETAARLRLEDSRPKPLLMGRDLIALGYAPSPQFAVWLKACFDAQLDGAFHDHDGAVAYFRAHAPSSVNASPSAST